MAVQHVVHAMSYSRRLLLDASLAEQQYAVDREALLTDKTVEGRCQVTCSWHLLVLACVHMNPHSSQQVGC